MESLDRAVAGHRSAVEAERRARLDLYKEIRRARESGVPQVEIARRTGYTREHLRRIEREQS